MKFQLLIKIDFIMEFSVTNHENQSFIPLIIDKMPTIVGILTFMSRKISCSAELSMRMFYNHMARSVSLFAKTCLSLSEEEIRCVFDYN